MAKKKKTTRPPAPGAQKASARKPAAPKPRARKPRPKRKPTGNPPGRPHVFSEELATQICDLAAEGLSLRQIFRRKGMPTRTTVFGWTRSAEPKHQAFARELEAAREMGRESLYDEVLDEARAVTDEDSFRRARSILNAVNSKVGRMTTGGVAAGPAPGGGGTRVQCGSTEGPDGTVTSYVTFETVPGADKARHQAPQDPDDLDDASDT